MVPHKWARFLLSQFLRRAIAREILAQTVATRVVRVGLQLVLTEAGQCVQAVRVLFHGPSMPRRGRRGSAQFGGICV